MVKRSDGKVYADLHKCHPTMYLEKSDADSVCAVMNAPPSAGAWHVVPMVAETESDWEETFGEHH